MLNVGLTIAPSAVSRLTAREHEKRKQASGSRRDVSKSPVGSAARRCCGRGRCNRMRSPSPRSAGRRPGAGAPGRGLRESRQLRALESVTQRPGQRPRPTVARGRRRRLPSSEAASRGWGLGPGSPGTPEGRTHHGSGSAPLPPPRARLIPARRPRPPPPRLCQKARRPPPAGTKLAHTGRALTAVAAAA